jgi:protease-4
MAEGRGKWVAIILAIVIVAFLWIGAIAYFFISAAGGGRARDGFREYEELVIEEGDDDKVAMIELSGVITSELAGPPGTAINDDEVAKQLKQAREDDSVVAVILDIDTPGGEVVASDNIYRQIQKLTKAKKPVIALMGATAASGGYYVSAAADEVVANSETLTGSIGVILTVFNVEGAAEKLGINETVIKSGPHKDIASPFRTIPPEEQAILQGLIDEAFNKFIDIVAEGRELERSKVVELADGRVYSGKQAQDLGLVDHLGDQDTAFGRAKARAKSRDATLVKYERSVGLGDLLSPLGGVLGQRSTLEQQTGIELRPNLKYLWIP